MLTIILYFLGALWVLHLASLLVCHILFGKYYKAIPQQATYWRGRKVEF